MQTNAYILDWTMNDYDSLKKELGDQDFSFTEEQDTNHIRALVPFDRVDAFALIIQSHLNNQFNYVDVQFQDEKTTVIIFMEKVFFIRDTDTNNEVKQWAIEKGLPPEQADWSCSF